MGGENNKKGKSKVYVSLPSRRARSGGQMKTQERIQTSAEKTMRKALVEGRSIARPGSYTQVYVGGLIPTTHPEHVTRHFADCGRILNVEFVCLRGTANLQGKPPARDLPGPMPGQLPTLRRTLRPRHIEENEKQVGRQTWMYAIVHFDDAASAARALAKNGDTLGGFDNTECVIRVVTSTSELEEVQELTNTFAMDEQPVPYSRDLKRVPTRINSFVVGRTEFAAWELWRPKEQAVVQGAESSTRTLRAKATANRVKWLQTEATIRPSQKAAMGGLMSAVQMGLKALCGISFKLTIV
ncbi:unnamed protein product [Peniophora sp. CBMAI 1063]|nr:unnamed protein product [Peniophora sp. CBMAI 1063]